jgi:hypothetical protein
VRRKRAPVNVLTQYCGERVGHVVTLERAPAGQHLVKRRTESPDVHAPVDRVAFDLFGRHERRSTENHPGPGHGRRGDCGRFRNGRNSRLTVNALYLDELRKPEVEDLDHAIRSHFDVGGLEVAMNDSLFVGGFERLGNLLRYGQSVIEQDRPLCDPIRERRPLY